MVLGLLLAREEPRRLVNGLVVLAGLSMLPIGILGLVVSGDQNPGHVASALVLLVLMVVVGLHVLVLAWVGIHHGVVVLRRERLTLANALALIGGLGLLGCLALPIAAVALDDQFLVLLALAGLLPVAYLGFVLTAFGGSSWAYARQAGRRDPTEAVIVLGSGLAGDRVTPLLAGRLAEGLRHYQRGRERGLQTVLVTSGGQGPGEAVPEARAMADWLIDADVPASHVLLEDRSRNTWQNLANSREVLAGAGVAGPVTVATSDFHAFRAATLLRGLGMDGDAVGARTARYFWPSAMLREFAAVLRDHLFLNVILLAVLSLPVIGLLVAALINTIR